MSLWKRLFSTRRRPAESPPAPPPPRGGKAPIPLPTDPNVFECRDCGKVFEARRLRPLCPECDSGDVDLMST